MNDRKSKNRLLLCYLFFIFPFFKNWFFKFDLFNCLKINPKFDFSRLIRIENRSIKKITVTRSFRELFRVNFGDVWQVFEQVLDFSQSYSHFISNYTVLFNFTLIYCQIKVLLKIWRQTHKNFELWWNQSNCWKNCSHSLYPHPSLLTGNIWVVSKYRIELGEIHLRSLSSIEHNDLLIYLEILSNQSLNRATVGLPTNRFRRRCKVALRR